MTYESILNNIFTALPMYHKVGSSAYKEGFENIEALTAVVGHPEQQLKCIHVAGTNGKGSTSHLLASFYQELGMKVGLYTSPHLVDFRERIRVNGEMISKEAVVTFFEKFNEQFKVIEPSFFEMTTALAFYHFASQKVDIAIVEVGLGGRLDATNIIHPQLCIITNISMDHTQLLGDTLAKIAGEKAGIIKEGVPVVIGKRQEETQPVFEAKAAALHAPLHTTEDVEVTTLDDTNVAARTIRIQYQHKNLIDSVKLPLPGDYQLENVATFVKSVLVLHPCTDNMVNTLVQAIENVLKNTHLHGRWEIIAQNPLVICDTGHNSGGFTFLSKQLTSLSCQQLHCIIGFVNDKDIDSIIHLLPPKAKYTVCKASVARAEEPEKIVHKMLTAGLNAVPSSLSVYDTYLQLKQRLNKDDALYIGGSTFIVADLLAKMDHSL